MTEMKCVVFWGVVTFFWTLCRGDVSCVFSQVCFLPCSFQPADQPAVHWTRLAAAESVVHSYYDGRDQVQHQNQNFRGRTSLFVDRVSSGNASLLLTGVKVQDQGRYLCNCSTSAGTRLAVIRVSVDAPVKTVNLRQAENRVVCSSDEIYPEPNLTWSTEPPSEFVLQSSTLVQRTEQQLFNISSSLKVPHNDTDLTYVCTVRTRRNHQTSRLENPKTEGRVQGLGIVVGVILVSVSTMAVPFCVEKCTKSRKSKRSRQQNISIEEQQLENRLISSHLEEEQPGNGPISSHLEEEQPGNGPISSQLEEQQPGNGPISSHLEEEQPENGPISSQLEEQPENGPISSQRILEETPPTEETQSHQTG
ncbi:programmed cell death 1 ligand 1-like [Gambusia affinis]|uniref:programmed cell death 1 ligand 1-like n=1 Tax=Gambusia affinis TaxID=33528 RepID=UPI001CDC5E23|nr:programmed cell death 1 ligand 1-like [Gambusia affinis]